MEADEPARSNREEGKMMFIIAAAGLVSGIVLVIYSGVLLARGDEAGADRKLIIALILFHSVGSMAR